MRKLVVLGGMLLLWAGSVRAQSCTGYSANVIYTPLAPSDVAARGGVTVTLTATANGGIPSHRVTVTPGTVVNFDWTSHNATAITSASNVTGDESGSPLPWNITSYPVTYGTHGWQPDSADVGHTLAFHIAVTDGTNTTQDVVYVTVVDGSGPSIVSQDELPTNGYAQVTITFGGGSMMNNCTECNTNPRACVNATHTPYVTMSAVNHTTGESQSLPRQQAGNVANSTSSVSGSGSIWISILPGDDVGGTANAEIFCTMFGDLPVSGNDDWGIDWELAWTKFSTIQSSCLPAGGNPPSIGCKVTSKFMCSTDSQPADLQPAQVFAEYDTNGNPVTLETVPPFWWGWGFGIRGHVSMFKTPWIFPANVLQQYKVGDLSSWAHVVLEVAAGSFPSNSTIRKCTNKDAGTSPEVVPPFDQP